MNALLLTALPLLVPPQDTEPLVLRFPEPLDHALLQRLLTIQDEAGSRIEGPAEPLEATAASTVSDVVVECVARSLRDARDRGALWLGGHALGERGVVAAERIAAATDCRLVTGSFPGCSARGGSLPAVERLPYFPDAAARCVESLERVVLVESEEPVTFFGYPKVPSQILADKADRAVAHTTSGACLQQNLVAVLEGE